MKSNPLYLTELGSLTKGSIRLFFTETVPAWLSLLAVWLQSAPSSRQDALS